MPALSPLPITGYSVLHALGADRDTVAAALAGSVSGLVPCPIALPFETRCGVVSPALDPLTGMLAPWDTRIARMGQALVQTLEPALARARSRWRPERIGVILGTSTAGAEATERAYKAYVDEGALPVDYDFTRQHTYGPLLHVVGTLAGATGPAWMISTACTSSAKPLGSARRLIAADMLDAVIVGGIDTLCAMTLTGFDALGALSHTTCRPFAADRDGINIGEGGALLLVERRGDAVALLEGVGESSDAYHISAPHPEGLGARLAMERALAMAGLSPEDVDTINAHGTGTRHNDVAEAAAIHALFGGAIPVVSTKGFIGHTLGAAGAAEAVMGILAIEEGLIPASLGAAPLDERIAICVPTTPQRARVRRVVSNSFAFGGNNISVVLGAP